MTLGESSMRNVTLLVKPASSRCNMRCRYCFYTDLSQKREQGDRGLMSPETAEALIRSAFEAVEDGGGIQFAFQGGEPTLAGLAFYRSFVQLEQKYRRPGVAVTHAIQTNGLAVDEAWAEFFHEAHFLVGLSMDGFRDLHDFHRADAAGRGSWSRAAKALALLQRYEVELNVLCVVTRQCAHSPQRAYRALKKLGVRYLQFIPCLDPLNEARGGALFSLLPQDYGKFLCGLFDAWYLDWKRGEYVSIRLFDDYVHLMTGLPASTCSTTGHCGNYLVVEADGTLYPCDFYAVDQWRLGQIGQAPLTGIFQGEKTELFCDEALHRPAGCSECRWFPLCNGGCKRDWTRVGHEPKNYLCPAFQQFFAYAESRLKEIARTQLY